MVDKTAKPTPAVASGSKSEAPATTKDAKPGTTTATTEPKPITTAAGAKGQQTKAGKVKTPKKAPAKAEKVPIDYVSQLQDDLVKLGYLKNSKLLQLKYKSGVYDELTKRAVRRFQIHAARVYRMGKQEPKIQDVKPEDVFDCPADEKSGLGTCDYATAQEIRKWIDNGWVLPLKRFGLKEVIVKDGDIEVALELGVKGKPRIHLREDVADAWTKIANNILKAGGTIEKVYGDAFRSTGYMSKGSSVYSYHYAGRAVDINQDMAKVKFVYETKAVPDPKNKKKEKKVTSLKVPKTPTGPHYIICHDKNPDGTNKVRSDTDQPYWRVYSWAKKQDGTQGTFVKSGQLKRIDFSDHNKEKDVDWNGYYIDLTEMITDPPNEPSLKNLFEAIPARKGWESEGTKREWWHFQYVPGKQRTFLDEMELIGKSEADLLPVRKVMEDPKDKMKTIDVGPAWIDTEALDRRPG